MNTVTNRLFNSLSSRSRKFGVCFDIDGVLRRGPVVLPGAIDILKQLTANQVPHLFMTNGGGYVEAEKAANLQNQLNDSLANPADHVAIHEDQLIQSHTPMKALADEYANKRVMILGCRKEEEVAASYGFNKIVTPQEFVKQHPMLCAFKKHTNPKHDPYVNEPVEAIFVLHDPVDWHLEIQICMDVLQGFDPLGERYGTNKTGPLIGKIPVFNSNEDFVFSSEYDHPRFAQGAFLECLQHLYTKCTGLNLNVIRYGKPNSVTFNFAEKRLQELSAAHGGRPGQFDQIYMIGDNPKADILGSNLAGDPWHSILLRSGVFNPGSTDLDPSEVPKAELTDVGEALEYIFEREHLEVVS